MLQLNLREGRQIEPGQKVVPAEHYQAWLDGEGIIAAARAEAERIVREAQVAYEEQKQQGYDDGLLEGRMEMAEKMVDSVGQAVDYFGNLEVKLKELVLKAVRRIVGDFDVSDRGTGVVLEALSLARNQTNVTLRICPAEADAARARLTEITKPYPGIHYLEVVPDPRLGPSDCILESELGVVDASIDVQLKAIEKSLAKTLGGGAG